MPARPRPSSALDKALIANENKINEAVAKGDKAAFAALVAADGWSVDGNGFMKVVGLRSRMLDQVKIKTWKISDEKVDLDRSEHGDRHLQVDRLGHVPGTAVPAGRPTRRRSGRRRATSGSPSSTRNQKPRQAVPGVKK